MIIPTKFNGYQAGIRLYPSGGGGNFNAVPQSYADGGTVSFMGGGGTNSYYNQISGQMSGGANKTNTTSSGGFGSYNPDNYTPQSSINLGATGLMGPPIELANPEVRANFDNSYNFEGLRNLDKNRANQTLQRIYSPAYTDYATVNRLGVSQYGTPQMQPLTSGGAQLPQTMYGGVGAVNPSAAQALELYKAGDTAGAQAMLKAATAFNATAASNVGGAGGTALTPALARSLMERAMTTGLPKTESDRYGGYDAIKAMYTANGGDFTGNTSNTSPQIGQNRSPGRAQAQTYTFAKPTMSALPTMYTPFDIDKYMQTINPSVATTPTTTTPTATPRAAPYTYDQIKALRNSSGPRQAIVGRSSQMRGTPNVMMRRGAEGGIMALLGDDE
jgi:hypothetical protein